MADIEDGEILSVHNRQLDTRTPALKEIEAACQVVLCDRSQEDQATCLTRIDDRRIAVGYRSRRCEVIELPTHPGRNENEKVVYAVGYTPDTPNSMILSRGPEGDYLVVTTAQGVFWFKYPA